MNTKIILGLSLLLFIGCKDETEEINPILIYKIEQLIIVNDSLQRELEYANANLDVCKSYHFEE